MTTDPTAAPSFTDVKGAPDLPPGHPLSDRLRWLKVLFLAALLAASGWHLSWRMDRDVVDVGEMLADPDTHVGGPVLLGNFKVVSIDAEGAELWSPWAVTQASPVPQELQVGDAISLRGTFGPDRRIRASEWKIHELLWLKKLIGLTALALVLLLVTWELLALRRSHA